MNSTIVNDIRIERHIVLVDKSDIIETIPILNFHHTKYLEIDGYDEIILIENDKHNQIRVVEKRNVPKHILRNSSCRLQKIRKIHYSDFYGPFCLLNHKCHYTVKGKVYK